MVENQDQINNKYLTQKQAQSRDQKIKRESIYYDLSLDLLKSSEQFFGNIRIQFDMITQEGGTFLDFCNQKIDSMKINDQNIQQIDYNGLFIQLPEEYLRQEKNVVEIQITCDYANDGSGLHSFKDTDQQQYLYSQFAPYMCNKMFPCFDQPSLKAYLSLTVTCVQNWVLVSNENIISETVLTTNQDSKSSKIVIFNRTKLLPTYIFVIVAGPYAQIDAKNTYRNIPMRLFCRQSLYQYLLKLSNFILEVTNKSFEFYEGYFKVQYPFDKYDQIFCPEFKWGAMENAAAVTFNDQSIYTEEVDSLKYSKLANTISHELSHQWFGNYVTNFWWNDIWLNESFADFISHFCLSKFEIKEKKLQNMWLNYNLRKAWGYRVDNLITTHSIATNVPNTDAANNVFDGITYSKGGATIRQLMALVGEENFSKGLTSYFNEFAFKNATLQDFIKHINNNFDKNQVGFDLVDWTHQWIQKPGLNECYPNFDSNNQSEIVDMIINQTAALQKHPTLRYHKIAIAFFREDASIDSIDVVLKNQPETIVTYDGRKQYKAVFLNYKDYAFIKVLLDQNSKIFFENNLMKIKDDLLRTLIWKSFYDMVRDAKMSFSDFRSIFIKQIKEEKDEDIISNQFSFLNLLTSYIPEEFSKFECRLLFDFTFSFIEELQQKNNHGMVAALKQYLLAFAKDESSIELLIDIFLKNKQGGIYDLNLGKQLEWQLVYSIHKSSKYSLSQKQEFFKIQNSKDQSDVSLLIQEKCYAATADEQQRNELWKQYLDPNNKKSLQMLSSSFEGYASKQYEDLALENAEIDKWINQLNIVFYQRSSDFANKFYENLKPSCRNYKYLLGKLSEVAESYNSNKLLSNSLKSYIDNLQRVDRCQQCYLNQQQLQQQKQHQNQQ